jgi:hypothetical protein
MEAVQDLALGDGVRIDGVLTSGFVIQEASKKGNTDQGYWRAGFL